jgi:hypothetical protein
MQSIQQTLFTNWGFMRWLRLLMGAYLLVYAVQTHDFLPGLLAGILLLQALTNTGCSAMNACSAPAQKKPVSGEIEFEEIK